MVIDTQVVKMYRRAVHECWQEEPIEDAEYVAYFLRIEDDSFSVKGNPPKKKVSYYKLGEWWEMFGSKEHPFVREVI